MKTTPKGMVIKMLDYGITDCLRKARSTDKPADFPKITKIQTAKNRKAAFQIVFSSDNDCVLRLGESLYYRQRCDCDYYRLKISAVLNTQAYPEGFMKDDDGTLKADILLEDSFLEINAGVTAAVWVDIDVPADTQTGDYMLDIRLYGSRMFSDEVLISNDCITVCVSDYVLPEPRDTAFYLDLWQHCSCIARAHETEPYGEKHFEILDKYVASLAALGQKAVTVIASEIPWSGQSCFDRDEKANLYEYSMIRVTKKANGRFSYDFSLMQRYIDLCFSHGINKEISVYGLVNVWKGDPKRGFSAPASHYPSGIRVRYYDEAKDVYAFMRRSSEIDCYIRAIQRYFVAKRLDKIVRIAADEPADTKAFEKEISRIRKNAPLLKLKAALNHAEFIDEFGDEISDFVPCLSPLCMKFDAFRQLIADKEKRCLWYVCCWPPHPNTFLGSDLCEALFIAVLTKYLGLDGFLRWSYSVFNDDMRADIKYFVFAAGDLNFVYPSRNGSPLLSLRYKAMKYATELFEMLNDAEKICGADGLENLYSIVIKEKNVSEYFTPDELAKERMMSLMPEDYEKLNNALLGILKK